MVWFTVHDSILARPVTMADDDEEPEEQPEDEEEKPAETLIDASKEGDWDRLLELLPTAGTDGASARDDWGRLPLHYAALQAASLEVFTGLLAAYPAAADAPIGWDEMEKTALDYAEETGCSDEVVAALKAASRREEGEGAVNLRTNLGVQDQTLEEDEEAGWGDEDASPSRSDSILSRAASLSRGRSPSAGSRVRSPSAGSPSIHGRGRSPSAGSPLGPNGGDIHAEMAALKAELTETVVYLTEEIQSRLDTQKEELSQRLQQQQTALEGSMTAQAELQAALEGALQAQTAESELATKGLQAVKEAQADQKGAVDRLRTHVMTHLEGALDAQKAEVARGAKGTAELKEAHAELKAQVQKMQSQLEVAKTVSIRLTSSMDEIAKAVAAQSAQSPAGARSRAVSTPDSPAGALQRAHSSGGSCGAVAAAATAYAAAAAGASSPASSPTGSGGGGGGVVSAMAGKYGGGGGRVERTASEQQQEQQQKEQQQKELEAVRSQAKKDREELEAKLQRQTGEMAELRAMLSEAVAVAKEQRGEIDELKRQIASGAAQPAAAAAAAASAAASAKGESSPSVRVSLTDEPAAPPPMIYSRTSTIGADAQQPHVPPLGMQQQQSSPALASPRGSLTPREGSSGSPGGASLRGSMTRKTSMSIGEVISGDL